MGVPLSGGGIPSSSSELDRLRTIVARYFPVYETTVGPQSVTFAVHVDRATLEPTFRSLADELWAKAYVGLLRERTGETFIEVVHRPPVSRGTIWINLGLLAATLVTTILTGALIWNAFVGGASLTESDFVFGALFFALPLVAILGGHELAHYFMSRHYRLDASLPYFMPIPPPFLFGTLGAFISIRQPFTDRKVLFDIGAAGPIAGFLIAIPITFAGLYLSWTLPAPSLATCGITFLGTSYSNILIGQSLLWIAFLHVFPTQILYLHPLALAGWVGIFVTAINLLPAGQLDGGHVWRGLFGDKSRYLSYAIVILLLLLGLFVYLGWLIFAFLILLLGARHPPPLNDASPLGWKRTLVGVAVAAILISGFVLVPVAAETGQIGGTATASSHFVTPAPGYALAVAARVNLSNQDVAAHGIVLGARVLEVYLNNSSTPLNASAREAWASTSDWTLNVSGEYAYANSTANASAPVGAGYFAINAGATIEIQITYANTQSATGIELQLVASEVCPAPGSSPATVDFSPSGAT